MTDHSSELDLRNDGWTNTTTGVGGPLDKSAGFIFSASYIDNDYATLELLYEEDHLAGKICDATADAVFRRGWEFSCSDQSVTEPITEAVDALDLEAKVDQALRWNDLYGGAAIFLGVDDGAAVSEPLNTSRVRSLKFLSVYDRWELTPHSHYSDPLSPKYGEVAVYRLHPRNSVSIGANVGVYVHESRLVVFRGRPTTKTGQVKNLGWGQSKLVRTYSSVKNYGGALASVLALLADASQGVYKIKGLAKIIEGGKSAPLRERFSAIQQIRGIINAVVLDADGEDYSRVATALTEVANIVDRFKIDVASAAEIPATVLFGQAPAGLNATGESDMRNWYDRIAVEQRRRVRPAMERVLRVLLRSKLGPTRGLEPQKWAVKFPSLWTPTAKEAAEIRKINADTDAVYFDLGALTLEQIARARFSGEEQSDTVTLKPEEIAALSAAQKMLASPAEDLPPPNDQVTTDDEGAEQVPEGEPLSVVEARALAQQMTEHSVKRCEHNRVNSCPRCGIERVRVLLSANEDGTANWGTAWRAIADGQATAPAATAPDSSDQES